MELAPYILGRLFRVPVSQWIPLEAVVFKVAAYVDSVDYEC